MEAYTIEDIETIRKKSGLTYQEAVALLDYHNGSLARALIDLEKNGRLKEDNAPEGKEVKRNMSNTEKHKESREKALNLLQKLYRCRIKIQKDETTVLNFSSIFGAACLLFAPHMTILGVIISMILGYNFSFTKMDPAFSTDNLEKMVRSAAQNAKNSVSSVVQTISTEAAKAGVRRETADPGKNETKKQEQAATTETADIRKDDSRKKTEDDPAENLRQQTKEIEETMDSFFESNPAATTYRSAYSAAASSVPTIQVPVQTETREGTVHIDDNQDGYATVTIG